MKIIINHRRKLDFFLPLPFPSPLLSSLYRGTVYCTMYALCFAQLWVVVVVMVMMEGVNTAAYGQQQQPVDRHLSYEYTKEEKKMTSKRPVCNRENLSTEHKQNSSSFCVCVSLSICVCRTDDTLRLRQQQQRYASVRLPIHPVDRLVRR